MRLVFFGEGTTAGTGSPVMAANKNRAKASVKPLAGEKPRPGMISNWIEVWDYAGDASFRGFVTASTPEKALFVLLDEALIGNDLKHGQVLQSSVMTSANVSTRLIALIDLASAPFFECSRVVLCLDRGMDPVQTKHLIRDLGWVGFAISSLRPWAKAKDELSPRWLFLSMET